jgi:hypothetical protein
VLLVVIVVILALILGGRYAWRQHAARTAANKSSATAIVSIPSTPEPRNLSEDASSTGPASDNEPNIPLGLSIVASGGT